MEISCFCSLDQSPDGSNFPKKNLSFVFDIQSHPPCHIHNYWLHFFYQGLTQNLPNCKVILDGDNNDFVPCFGTLTFRYSK